MPVCRRRYWRPQSSRCQFVAAGIGDHKAAGAIGRLDHAGLETRLAEGRRLLIAGNPTDRYGHAEMLFRRQPEIALAVAHLRQHLARNPEPVEQPRVPCAGADVEQLGAGGVGRVGGMQRPARELAQQKAVDRTEAHLAARCPLAQARHVVEQPCKLRRREIGIDDEPGGLGHMRGPAFLFERGAKRCGAPVLPHDGVGERLAGCPLPHHRRLALIGAADGDNRARVHLAQHRAADLDHGPPDFIRIVLDLSRSRIDLPKRQLRACAGASRLIEQNSARAGRPLVDGKDVAAAHSAPAPPVSLTIQAQYSALPPAVGSTNKAGTS